MVACYFILVTVKCKFTHNYKILILKFEFLRIYFICLCKNLALPNSYHVEVSYIMNLEPVGFEPTSKQYPIENLLQALCFLKLQNQLNLTVLESYCPCELRVSGLLSDILNPCYGGLTGGQRFTTYFYENTKTFWCETSVARPIKVLTAPACLFIT